MFCLPVRGVCRRSVALGDEKGLQRLRGGVVRRLGQRLLRAAHFTEHGVSLLVFKV